MLMVLIISNIFLKRAAVPIIRNYIPQSILNVDVMTEIKFSACNYSQIPEGDTGNVSKLMPRKFSVSNL